MSATKKLASVIADAVRCLPPEICRILIDYTDRPHSWKPFETVRVTKTTTDDNQTEIAGTDDGYRLMVSTQTLATGTTRWSVEIRLIGGWMAVGITSAPNNLSATIVNRGGTRFLQIAAKTRMHIFASDGIVYAKDDDRYQPISSFAKTAASVRVVVQAFSATRTIRVFLQQTFADGNWRTSHPFDMAGVSGTDFFDLRPCVLIGGRNLAVVRSS